MTPINDTLDIAELVWLVLAFTALLVSSRHILYAWKDWRVVYRRHINGPRRIVALGWLRRCGFRFLAFVGLFAAALFSSLSPEVDHAVPYLRWVPELLTATTLCLWANTYGDLRDMIVMQQMIHAAHKQRATDTAPGNWQREHCPW